MSKSGEKTKLIAEILHFFGIITFTAIGVLFSMMIVKLLIEIFTEGLPWNSNPDLILEKTFLIFLFIEIIAAIKIYFTRNFHFPLRFFFYIGMTDLIRKIIISLDQPDKALTLTIALLIITIAFSLLEIKSKYLHKKQNKPFKSEEEQMEI